MRRAGSILVVLSAYCVGTQAMAAGFAITEHGASGLGNAFAGAAAAAEDASTVWFNPAAMTLLQGRQLSPALHVIVPRIEFQNEGSTLTPLVGNGPLSGGDGGDAGETILIPNLYYAQPLSDSFTFGLGINAPFGFTTNYEEDWAGRYHAIDTEVLTVNFNPNIGWKVNDSVALGFGLNALYFDGELSSAIDQSSICLGLLGAACGGIGLGTPGNPATDGRVRFEGDDWGYGFNLGALFTVSENLRIGTSYRSEIEIEARGDVDFENISPAFTASGLFADSGGSAEIDLPASLSVSALYQLTDAWSWLADVTWTDWSQFDELRVQFDNPAQPDSVTDESWDDSYRYSLGLRYQPDTIWTYRFGVAYDETPIPNKERRTPRIPDEDRLWLALGLSYAPVENLRLDLGYAHLFISDTEIENTLESQVPHVLRGNYELEADIVSAQLNWLF
ncbi:MAG: OmpP1/FadL family transporter [Gammaproteobacteria bacterium]